MAAAPAYPNASEENNNPIIPVVIENSIENSPLDAAQVVIELEDYSISGLKKSALN